MFPFEKFLFISLALMLKNIFHKFVLEKKRTACDLTVVILAFKSVGYFTKKKWVGSRSVFRT